LLVIALSSFAAPGIAVSGILSPDGTWFIDGTGVAVQIFDCSGIALRPDHLVGEGV
jgi:hypothetical protein